MVKMLLGKYEKAYNYVCLECGAEFDDYVTWRESRGEYWGVPCSEEMCGCPNCYGAFDDIEYVDTEEELNDEEEEEEDEL